METYRKEDIRRGDIYYADLSPVVGSEQGGIRPVVILQNNVGNRHSPTVIAAAITSRKGKHKLPIQLPKAAPASTDALRIENELALCFNRADINPEYMKTLIMAAAAERYAGLNDPTPAHRLALLRQKLELEPENEETLWELFESAVTHVCIGKGGEISLSQKDQKECAS